MSSRENTEPKWLNPCGHEGGSVNGAASDHRIPDEQLIEQVINQARIAQNQAKTFLIEFVQKSFNTGLQTHHDNYKNQDFDWLPTKTLPKKLGESVPLDHLESLELHPTLVNVYGYLQQIAVGLEQVVWDEEDKNGVFKSSFTITRDNLYSVLCEVNMAISENNLNSLVKNITREIMGEQFRNMENNTSMNVRNWIICRDYLNILEYIIDVFEFFKKELPTIG